MIQKKFLTEFCMSIEGNASITLQTLSHHYNISIKAVIELMSFPLMTVVISNSVQSSTIVEKCRPLFQMRPLRAM